MLIVKFNREEIRYGKRRYFGYYMFFKLWIKFMSKIEYEEIRNLFKFFIRMKINFFNNFVIFILFI